MRNLKTKEGPQTLKHPNTTKILKRFKKIKRNGNKLKVTFVEISLKLE